MNKRVKVWRRALNANWDRLVWRVFDKGLWGPIGELRRAFTGKTVRILKLRPALRTVRALAGDIPWDLAVNDGGWQRPFVYIYADKLSLFSELQPLFDRLESGGIMMAMSSESAESKLRWFQGKIPGGGAVHLTASLGYNAECQVIDTGEMKPVQKFVCPGDPEYPQHAVAP